MTNHDISRQVRPLVETRSVSPRTERSDDPGSRACPVDAEGAPGLAGAWQLTGPRLGVQGGKDVGTEAA